MTRAVMLVAVAALACRDEGPRPGGADAPRSVWVADTQVVRDSLGQELEIVIGREATSVAKVEPRKGARDPGEPGLVRGLEPRRAYDLMRAARPGWFVIDLRGPEAFGRIGHLPGAAMIEPHQLEPYIDKLMVRTDQTVLVYDDTGSAAPEVARLMASYGFPAVRWIEGGFAAWRAAGLPVEEPR